MNNKTESSDQSTSSNDAKGTSAASKAKPVKKPAGFKWKKWLLIGAVVVAVIALAVVSMTPATIAVEAVAAKRGPLSVSVDAQGRTRAKLRYTVGAPISGRLMRTTLREGDRIEQGDALARIAPPPTDARTAATARAELAAAQARQRQAVAAKAEAASNLKLANSELARRTALFAQGFIGAEALEIYAQAAQAAVSRLDVAQATLAAAVADVQSARSRLLGAGTGAGEGTIEIRAPVSGVVLKVYEESERVVASGNPLFDLSKGNALELLIDVLTQDAVHVKSGDPIRVTGWGGSDTLKGKVRHVEPGAFTKVSTLGVEEQRVNVVGDLLDAPDALGAGYRIEAAIVTWSAEDVLVVPTGALFRRSNAWHAFVIEGGRARLRTLEIAHRSTEFAEVKAGIKLGEEVIIYPSGLIADGTHVDTQSRQP